MSLPRTRFDEAAGDFERELFDAWRCERPSTHARRRVLALVGAGAALGATAVTSTAGAQAPLATAKIAGWGTTVIAKWLAVCAVAGTAAGIAAHEVRGPRSTGAATPDVTLPERTPSRSTPVIPVPMGTTANRGLEASPVVPARRVDGPARNVAPPRPRSSSAPTDSRLGEQVATVSRARDALARGDSEEAIRLLDVYESTFPDGAFAPEAAAMRIEALQKQGP